MNDSNNNPREDDTTVHDEWNTIEQLQNVLSNALRRHERGDSLPIEDILSQADTLLGQARGADTPQIVDQSLRDLMAAYWDTISQRKEGASTGLKCLDAALGEGFEPKRLVVVLGAPGAGKTAFTNQLADHVANSGRPVLYVTSEDSPFTLLAKTLARIGDVNYTGVLKGWASERAKINGAMAVQAERQSSDCLHYVDASQGISLDEVRQTAHSHFDRYPTVGHGILVVDYLQRLARSQRDLLGAGRDLREVVTALTEKLRSIAVELNCCVIALASQNRASGYGSNASGSALASAKESGDIEYTADVILALLEDTKRQINVPFLKARTLRIDKNRQGEIRTINLDWRGDRQQFTEAADQG